MSRPEQPTGRPAPQPYAWGGNVPDTTSQRKLAPNRKVLAGSTGIGVSGVIALLLTYHLGLPGEVAAAWTVLICLAGNFALAYFVPPGDNE